MMNIQVSKNNIGGVELNSVSARELHSALEVRTEFAAWIARRILEAQLDENTDFVKFVDLRDCNRITIILSLDSAKSIAMMERSEIGRKVRQYFIECERKALAAPSTPTSYLEALKALVASEEEKQSLALANQSLAIKVREAESFNCLAGACTRFGWPQGDADWRSAMGTVAAKIQKELDTRTEKIPDPRFGSVNAHDDRVWQHIEANIPGFKDVAVLYKYLGWKRKPKKFSR